MVGVEASQRYRVWYVVGVASLLLVACSVAERQVDERDDTARGGVAAHGGGGSQNMPPTIGMPAPIGLGGNPPEAGDGGGGAGGEPSLERECAVGQPFGKPGRVLGLTEAGSYDGKAWLMPDELSVYFASSRHVPSADVPGLRLWTATRETRDEMFGVPRLVEEPVWIDDVAMTDDGQTLFYVYGLAIIGVNRKTDLDFSLEISPGRAVGSAPWTSANGERVYLVHGSPPVIKTWYRGKATTESLVTPGLKVIEDNALTLSHDERELFVTAPGPRGDREIFATHRNHRADAFAQASLVAELNTADDDAPSWLSPDGCRLYFERSGEDGGIFVASRAPACDSSQGGSKP